MTRTRPLVIAHRGASGYRPEHTLAAYQLAIEQRADVIEPDLVITRDGILICRHENEIGGTTDVGDHPEFANRRTRKTIDGVPADGWFAEDFTFAEIKRLRARERLPDIRPENTRYDGEYAIPSFAEVIALAQSAPYPVAIYPETKHPTWFESEGLHVDGSPIHRSPGQLLIDALRAAGFTDPQRVYIQSFEIANLIELRQHIMPAAGVEFPLMQLFGDTSAEGSPGDGWAMPWDLHWHISSAGHLPVQYAGLAQLLSSSDGQFDARYARLATPQVLAWMRRTYARGVAPWKDNLLPRLAVDSPASRNTFTHARLTGNTHPLIGYARAADLLVHTYTLRADTPFRCADREGNELSAEVEACALLDAGVDGFFIDQPDVGVAARDDWMARGWVG